MRLIIGNYAEKVVLSKQAELLKTEKEQLANALSDISHQLKTPLTSMMVMADLLSSNDIEAGKRTEFTKNIEIQQERMEWLLTSLLKLSKIDAGTVEFKKDKIFASKLIQQAIKPLLIPIEFAMLKSVGITPKGFNKMLNYESIFYGVKTLLYGLPISFTAMYLIYRVLLTQFEFAFTIHYTMI